MYQHYRVSQSVSQSVIRSASESDQWVRSKWCSAPVETSRGMSALSTAPYHTWRLMSESVYRLEGSVTRIFDIRLRT